MKSAAWARGTKKVTKKINSTCIITEFYDKKTPLPFHPLPGLYNDLLEQERPFDEEAFLLLDTFVRRLCPPVCFVAHNGNRFDYPILLSELYRIGKVMFAVRRDLMHWFEFTPNFLFHSQNFVDDILCVDSYVAFKALLKPNHSNDVSRSDEPKTETVNPYYSLLDDGCDEAALAAVVDLHIDSRPVRILEEYEFKDIVNSLEE